MHAHIFSKVSAFLLLLVLVVPASAGEPGQLFPVNVWELAYQVEHVEYEEAGLMEEIGWLQGVAGGYETRVADKLMLQLQAEAVTGGMDYDGHYSDGSPATTHTDDTIFEARALAGWDFRLHRQVGLTPYAGLGWRYWNDMIRGAGGYEREIVYWYLPLGLEAAALSGDGLWRLGARAEYDLFLYGRATSHLGDAVAGWDTVRNDQYAGWGMRASLFAERELGRDWALLVEPFFGYWDIEKSEEADLTAGGRIIGRAWEPPNTTTIWGLRLGARY
ncbi:MAG: hypothetical protein AB1916_02425 [Thermodesulfobacteriota bacterium]